MTKTLYCITKQMRLSIQFPCKKLRQTAYINDCTICFLIKRISYTFRLFKLLYIKTLRPAHILYVCLMVIRENHKTEVLTAVNFIDYNLL